MEIREVPPTIGLGLDVVLRVSWGPGLLEEDHALRAVKQRVSAGVMLQIYGPGHIRKLKQRLIAHSMQFVEGIVKIILILELTVVFVSIDQDLKYPLSSIPTLAALQRGSAKSEALYLQSMLATRALRVSQEEHLWCSTIASAGGGSHAKSSLAGSRPTPEVLLRPILRGMRPWCPRGLTFIVTSGGRG